MKDHRDPLEKSVRENGGGLPTLDLAVFGSGLSRWDAQKAGETRKPRRRIARNEAVSSIFPIRLSEMPNAINSCTYFATLHHPCNACSPFSTATEDLVGAWVPDDTTPICDLTWDDLTKVQRSFLPRTGSLNPQESKIFSEALNWIGRLSSKVHDTTQRPAVHCSHALGVCLVACVEIPNRASSS